jgi:hypothetical protein
MLLLYHQAPVTIKMRKRVWSEEKKEKFLLNNQTQNIIITNIILMKQK